MMCPQPSEDSTWVYSPLHYSAGSETLPGEEEESETVSVNCGHCEVVQTSMLTVILWFVW